MAASPFSLLPSRGILTSVEAGSVFSGGAGRTYLPGVSTSPPAEQVVQTDPTSILVRALQRAKLKEEYRRRQGRLKRVAEEGEGAAPQPLAGKRGRAAGEPGALAGVASESAAAGAVGAPGVPLGSSGHAGSVAVGGGSASGPGLSSAGVPARAGAAASGRAGVARPGARAAAGPAIPPPQTASYTRLSLLSRTVKDLRAVCQAWGLAVSGNKNELAHRILAQQRQAGGR